MIVVTGDFREDTTRSTYASFGTPTLPAVKYESLLAAYASVIFDAVYAAMGAVLIIYLAADPETTWFSGPMPAILGPVVGLAAYALLTWGLKTSAKTTGRKLDEDILKRACMDRTRPADTETQTTFVPTP